MNLHPRLEKTIIQIVKELTRIEKDYYSASKLGIDEEMAQKILAVFIRRIPCEYYLQFLEEEVLPQVHLDDLLEQVVVKDDSNNK